MIYLNEYKLFTQRIGLVGISNIIVALSSIILLPLLTKNLTTQDYGLWVQLLVTIELLPNIILLGLPYTMVRFLAAEKNRLNIQETFYSITFLITLLSIVISVILFLSSKTIAQLLFDGNIEIATILPILVFVSCLTLILLNFFRTFQMMKIYSLFSIIQAYMSLVLIYILVSWNYGLEGAIIGLLITKVFIVILMVVIILLRIGFKIPRFKNMREYLSFGLPTVPGNLSYWVVTSSDRYVIGFLMGIIFVAYYSPSYVLGNILMMLISPFALLLPAALSKSYDNNNIAEVKIILRYSLKYFLVLGIPSAFGLSILSKNILLILTTSDIALNGYFVTPFVALGILFYGIYAIISHILVLVKKTKITGTIWIACAILNLGLNIILIPYLGIIGAALTTLIAYVVAASLTTYYSFHYMTFEFEIGFIVKTVISSIIMSIVIALINPQGILMIIFSILIGSVIYLAILIGLKGISRNELRMFKSFLNIN